MKSLRYGMLAFALTFGPMSALAQEESEPTTSDVDDFEAYLEEHEELSAAGSRTTATSKVRGGVRVKTRGCGNGGTTRAGCYNVNTSKVITCAGERYAWVGAFGYVPTSAITLGRCSGG